MTRAGETSPRPRSATRPSASRYLRAVALDLDGTVASHDRIDAETYAAIDRARARGVRVLIVTGRILAEMRAVFPDLESHVDAVVAENGAVVLVGRRLDRLAEPIGEELVAALRAAHVEFRQGLVLLAADARDEPVIAHHVRQAGLDCSLVRNRSELMVLPSSVTKATGLRHALADLHLSPHNTIAVGDAENDLSLFGACEIGAAVGNAVESLRLHADLVLTGGAGAGAIEVLDGDLLAGRAVLHPRRWRLALGRTPGGDIVEVPASQVNILLAGGAGTGKSYLAGLVVEQLVEQGYSVVVVDPEGDHQGLQDLPTVWSAGFPGDLSGSSDVARLLQSDHSVVIDLSRLGTGERADYLGRLPAEVQAQREQTGRPQWVVIDEAHGPVGVGGAAQRVLEPSGKGQLLITWQPEALSADAIAGLDIMIVMGSQRPPTPLVDLAAALGEVPRAAVAEALGERSGSALLVRRDRPGELVVFDVGQRATRHLRHEHKYDLGQLPFERAFHFRTADGRPTGRSAGTMRSLELELAGCDRSVLRHHCPRRDISRWIAEVLLDGRLADRLRTIEAGLTEDAPDAAVETTRLLLVAELQNRDPTLNAEVSGSA